MRITLIYGAAFLATGAVLLATAYALGFGLLHRLVLPVALDLATLAVASLWIGWFMAGRVLRPLRTITAQTREISEENLHERLALAGPNDELRELGDTIDGLLGRLESAFDAQRNFVANASHELRTPLTGIRVSIDVASRKSPRASEDASELAAKVRQDLDEVDRLLESFLVLARAQRGVMTDLTEVSLARLTTSALDARRRAAADRDISVQTALDEARVLGNETLLARMIGNLLDNAIRHNALGGLIDVQVHVDGPIARVIVSNSGPLLDGDKVSQLIEPFRRGGADRTGSENGVGLGLSIVAAIAAAHRGTVDLAGRDEGGLCVAVELPLATSPTQTGAPR